MDRVRQCFLPLLLVICTFSKIAAKDFPLLNLTTDDGLPSNTIYEVYRDSKGFLWFATDKGVARYNGLKFEVFTNRNGLADNEVFFFQEDKQGRLWLATFNGELCYYQNDTFRNSANTPQLTLPRKSAFIKNIIPMADGSVVITANVQSSFVRYHQNRVETIVLPAETRAYDFVNAYLQNEGTIMFRFSQAGISYNVNTRESVISEPEARRKKKIFSQNVNYFYDDSLIYSGNKPIGRFPENFFLTHALHRIYFSERNLFLATNNSLLINDSIEILKGNNLTSVTQDRKGDYWISTKNSGVYVLMRQFLTTHRYSGVYSGQALEAVKRGKHLFFSTHDELYDMADGKTMRIINYREKLMSRKEHESAPAIYIDSALRFYYLRTGEVAASGQITGSTLKLDYCVKHDFNIKSISRLGNDFYINTIGRIQKLSKDTLSKSNFHLREIHEQPNSERIFHIAGSPDNRIWFSTVSTMRTIDTAGKPMPCHLEKYPLKYFKFVGNNLLGYTHNNLLLYFTGYNGAFTVDTVPSQDCIWDKFYRLDSSHILLSTNNLYRLLTINPATTRPRISVSIVENPFLPLRSDCICNDSATCYFFKEGSIISVDARSIYTKSDPPQLSFRKIKAGNNVYSINSEMELSYRESRNITISYSTLSFGAKDVFYQYAISKGTGGSWRDIAGDINLAQTGFGTYIVRVRAKSSSSDYSVPIEFTLIVARPYWATWWFILAAVSAVAIVVIVIVRCRERNLVVARERKNRAEVRFLKSEYKTLNALMNPHFIFNTLNNVQDLINKNDRLGANEYLRIFADLVRQNMQNTSKELIPLQKELDLVKNYLLLEKLRFEDKLNYQVDVERGLDTSGIMVPPLLLQPIVENSIKHGILNLTEPSGFVYIQIFTKGNIVYLEVRDNGVGMAYKSRSNEAHESFGLENIKTRLKQLSVILGKKIELHISEMRDENDTLEWTVVVITIPLEAV